MALLSKEDILAVDDITEQEVPVPSWGGSVRVRSISHREMKKIKKEIEKHNGDNEDATEDDVEKFIFLRGVIQPSFTEEEYEHLLDKSTNSITTILNAILGTSGTGTKAVTEEEKQFPVGPERVLPVPTGGEIAHDSAGTPDGANSASQ